MVNDEQPYRNIRITRVLATRIKKLGTMEDTYEDVIDRLVSREEAERELIETIAKRSRNHNEAVE